MCDSAMTLRYSERDQTHYTVVLLTASVQLVTDLDRQAFIESGVWTSWCSFIRRRS